VPGYLRLLHLRNDAEFWLPYPLPSVARSEPSFRAGEDRLLWRGPTWINTNWFLVHGLRNHGFEEEARHIAARSAGAVLAHGFREFYDPLTGEGLRTRNFSWSTLLIDMF